MFLDNERWLLVVKQTHDPEGTLRRTGKIQVVDAELKDQADKLQKQMEQRLVHHCQSRITQPERRDHWCLRFAARNFPQVAAIIALFGQAKKDLSHLDNNQCLLAASSSFLKATSNSEATMDDCHFCCVI